MEKNNKTRNLVLTIVFLLFIFGFAIAGLVQKDRDFSEMENRNLAQFPEFSWKSLAEGNFTAGIESYMSDQVFLKDTFVSLKIDCERAVLKNYQNGIYFSDEDYYLQQYTENKVQINKNIDYVNEWVESLDANMPVKLMLVPNSIAVNADKLPAFSVNDDQLESVKYIEQILSPKIELFNAYDALKTASDNGEQVFYKTDHHWTDNGVKAVFEAFTGIKINTKNYNNSIVRDDFYGTLYSKAPSAFTEAETMILPQHDGDGRYTVEYVNENRKTDTLIDESFLDKKDKYASFMGGNFARVDIKANESVIDKKVLILKDSYANAMLPYLADYYSEIVMVDLRYYHMEEQTIAELVQSLGVDEVLLIYNMDFINTDNNFLWLT